MKLNCFVILLQITRKLFEISSSRFFWLHGFFTPRGGRPPPLGPEAARGERGGAPFPSRKISARPKAARAQKRTSAPPPLPKTQK